MPKLYEYASEENLNKFDEVKQKLKDASTTLTGETKINMDRLISLVERSEALYRAHAFVPDQPSQDAEDPHKVVLAFANTHMEILRKIKTVIGELRVNGVFLSGMSSNRDNADVNLDVSMNDLDSLRDANKDIMDQLTFKEWPGIKPVGVESVVDIKDVNAASLESERLEESAASVVVSAPAVTAPAPTVIVSAPPPTITISDADEPDVFAEPETTMPLAVTGRTTPPPEVRALASVYEETARIRTNPATPGEQLIKLDQVDSVVQEAIKKPSSSNVDAVSKVSHELVNDPSPPLKSLGNRLLAFVSAVIHAIASVASAVVSGVRSFGSHKEELTRIKAEDKDIIKGPEDTSSIGISNN